MDYLTHMALSHMWIVYVLFGNGFLLFWLAQNVYPIRRKHGETFENIILTSFLLSLLLNFSVINILFQLELSLVVIKIVFPVLTCSLIGCLMITHFRWGNNMPLEWRSIWSLRLLFYPIVFTILLYNGGMIEHISDAWYHMSIANKITVYHSLDVDNHLNGIASYNYPKLWHANLAILHTISGISLPEIWSAFTAWGAVLKISAFFLFALALSDNYRLAFIAALLYFLLPGMGDSYMRVSSWPAHISYTAMFFLLASAFTYLNSFSKTASNKIYSRKNIAAALSGSVFPIKEKAHSLVIPVIAAIIIYYTHRVELVWFTGAIFFYTLALVINEIFLGEKGEKVEPAFPILLVLSWLIIGASLVVTITTYHHMYTTQSRPVVGNPLLGLCFFIFLLLLLYTCIRIAFNKSTQTSPFCRGVLLLLFSALLVSIDYRHFFSLIFEQLSYPVPSLNEFPIIVQGWWGENLKLPSWHLQLRGGLMFSGLVSVGAAVAFLLYVRNRLSLFLAANAVFPLITIVSPYAYTWLGDVLHYHSVWRISIMIFTPLILATILCSLTRTIVPQ